MDTVNTQGTEGGNVTIALPGLTLDELIHLYRTDPVSGWSRLRYQTRVNHETLLKRLSKDYGEKQLREIRARDLMLMYQTWTGPENKKAMAHAFMGKLRTLCGYGTVMLENDECTRLTIILNKMRFAGFAVRKTYLTAEQVIAIRAKAHEYGYHSIALAQALQFELVFRQKDIVGEWVPLREPGESDVVRDGWKWMRGIRWEEISGDLILKHTTSKRQKEISIDLKNAPMAMEEIQALPDWQKRPIGPIVICESTSWPWTATEFRRKWRMIARDAGVPDEVCNMDSRAGGITEASAAGAELEHIKHAATHADIAQTQRYSRGAQDKIASVQAKRLAYRKALLGLTNTTRSEDR